MNTITVTVDPNQPAVGNTTTLGATVRVDDYVMDPTSMTLVVTSPSAVATIYAWPTATSPILPLTRITVGTFTQDVTASADGDWTFTWVSVAPSVVVSSGFLAPPLTEQVTVTVQTTVPAPIVGAYVTFCPNEDSVVAAGYTNSSGQVVANLLPGNYLVDVTLPKTMFGPPVPLVVFDTNSPQALTVIGTPLIITTTGTLAPTRIFGQVVDTMGAPKQGVRVCIEGVNYGTLNSFTFPTGGTITGEQAANLMVAGEQRDLLTDINGYWEADVPQGCFVRVTIPDTRFMQIVRVPYAVYNPSFPVLNIADCRSDEGSDPIGIDRDSGQTDF